MSSSAANANLLHLLYYIKYIISTHLVKRAVWGNDLRQSVLSKREKFVSILISFRNVQNSTDD